MSQLKLDMRSFYELAEEVSMLKLGIRTIKTMTTSANTTEHTSANRSTTYCSKKKIQLMDRMAAALMIFFLQGV